MKEVEERPKLRMMKENVNLECVSSCAVAKIKERRKEGGRKRGQC